MVERYVLTIINRIIITRNTFCGTWYLPQPRPQSNCSNNGRMHGACTKRLYFHFRSKIWYTHWQTDRRKPIL